MEPILDYSTSIAKYLKGWNLSDADRNDCFRGRKEFRIYRVPIDPDHETLYVDDTVAQQGRDSIHRNRMSREPRKISILLDPGPVRPTN